MEPELPAQDLAALRELAERHGILPAYEDVFGRRREASPQVLLEVLRALGAPLERPEEASELLRRLRQDRRRHLLDPVAVLWDGGGTEVPLRISVDDSDVRCGVLTEDGASRPLPAPPEFPAAGWSDPEGRTVVTRRIALPTDLPFGYHTLWAEVGGRRAECLLLRAPRRAWSPPEGDRRWGLFLPLYALRTERDWGVGDFRDLGELLRWTGESGGRLVGTLPLLAAFLDEPFEPSPYAPVSRLFWNELFVDPTRAPGWDGRPRAAGSGEAGLDAAALEADLRELRARRTVDYRRVAAVKRRALAPLARAFFEGGGEREGSFARFLHERPLAGEYARFRAAAERRGESWPAWPERMRRGELHAGDYDAEVARYHLFVQWLAEKQVAELSDPARTAGARLYLDLPLGAHAAGFDTWLERGLFAPGTAVGAPPDDFFEEGQNWGFPPAVPERMRERGYKHFRACLQHSLRHAGALRIDHVMSLHRLFWVPDGRPAAEGVYVRYPADELWAVVAIESHRHQALVVGEDLGTVPPEVRDAMARHGVHGMYVVQYEAREEEPALPPPRPDRLAALNTHDMFPWASWWEARDVEERVELGLLAPEAAAEERGRRRRMREALASFLQREGCLEDRVATGTALTAALEVLAAGPVTTLLANLEDLWLETHPQNVPGISDERRPNWRRRAARSLERLREDASLNRSLQRLDAARRGASLSAVGSSGLAGRRRHGTADEQ